MDILRVGAIVEILKDSEDILQALYFQTEVWQSIYSKFPELLMIDATYKLNNLIMPLYILMVVDGNEETEVIDLWIVAYKPNLP